MPKEKPSLIVKNKNASRNYKLDESFQAGIVLEGWEVKSLRQSKVCLLYTSPSPRDKRQSRMPSSA